MNTINIDEFSKVEIKIGTLLEATKVPDADRLLRLVFDFGPLPTLTPTPTESGSTLSQEENEDKENENIERLPELLEKYPGRDVKQIMSAIAPYIPDPSSLVGKQIAVCTNLEPRKFRGYMSQGMIMATDNEEGVVFMTPEKKVAPGAKIH